MTFPCNSFVLELDDAELTAIIRQSTAKRISEKRVTYLVDKLTKLANQSYCEVKKTSPMMEEIKYYAGELLRLSEYRQGVLDGDGNFGSTFARIRDSSLYSWNH